MAIIRYVEHPAVAHRAAMTTNLPRTTGRSLDEWLTLVAAAGAADRKARVAWLRKEHGLGSSTAALIAERAEGAADADGDPEALVDALFAGARAVLRPVADRLLAAAAALGGDVTATPCATMLPIRRAHVFARLRPATRTRLDLGLALGDAPAIGRLRDSGGLARGDRITHRVALGSPTEVDDEVLGWLRRAYEMDA